MKGIYSLVQTRLNVPAAATTLVEFTNQADSAVIVRAAWIANVGNSTSQPYRVRLCRQSTAGTNVTTPEESRLDFGMDASELVARGNCTTQGTVTATVVDEKTTLRSRWRWAPPTDAERITVAPGAIFGMRIAARNSSSLLSCGLTVEVVGETVAAPPPPPDPGDPPLFCVVFSGGSIVNVNPGNYQSAIANNPNGTYFRFAAGTYPNLPPKLNAWMVGESEADPTAVLIDGAWTRQNACFSATGQTYQNMTIQKFLGGSGSGTVAAALTGATDVCFLNLIARWNHQVGLRIQGQRMYTGQCLMYENGQYGFNGSGSDWLIENCEIHHCGDTDRVVDGHLIPRESSGNRGINKVTLSQRTTMHNIYGHHIEDKGLWYDINNEDMEIYECTLENIGQPAINIESNSVGRVNIHDNTLTNCMYRDVASGGDPQAANRSAIQISTTPDAEVHHNTITGTTTRGIGGYQWNHPNYTQPANPSGQLDQNNGWVHDLFVHHNTITASITVAGITYLSSSPTPSPLTAAANNRFQNNTYLGAAAHNHFTWGGQTWETDAQWAARGFS